MENQVLERNERIELGKARSKEIDLALLVGQSVELTKNSQKDLHGPCPICGDAGHDFHVSDSYFWAYCCNQQGDLLTYLQLTQKCSFVDACLHVAGGALPVATYRQAEAPPKHKGPPVGWLESAERKLHKAQALLNDDAGAAGRACLEGRGLHPATWAAFGLGLAHAGLPGTWDETTKTHTHPLQPAVVIPWFAQGGKRLVGLRYRFLPEDGHTYTMADGKKNTAKTSSKYGSDFTRRLFGGQVLPEFVFMPATEPSAERGRTLLICEGEINCMSIYQVAHETRLDVLSIGHETGALPVDFEIWAGRYGQILTWLDRPVLAAEMALKLPGAHAIASDSMGRKDANDLLQQELLGAFLATVRFQFCRNETERRALLWALADATVMDEGAAQVLQRIGQGMGISLSASCTR